MDPRSCQAWCLTLEAWALRHRPLTLYALSPFYSQGTINRSATWNKINMINQNVNPIIFLSVLAKGYGGTGARLITGFAGDQSRMLTSVLVFILTVTWPQIHHTGRLAPIRMDQGSRARSCIAFKPERTTGIPHYNEATVRSLGYSFYVPVFLIQYNTWQLICQGIIWDNY